MSKIHEIDFTSADGRPLTIATTRPELLPACVALYCHTADERYADLVGGQARVPLFNYQVPIKTDELVDPDFGTGLMMACTFGDSEDVVKWRRDHLGLRLVLEPDGRMGELAGEFAGLQITQARSVIVSALSASGVLRKSTSIKQVVGVHERCSTPVEFQIRPQWFIAVVENRDRLLARAEPLVWIPPFMMRRLDDWINGLKWDWNITRQRHYGVPFPVWFCDNCCHPIMAELDQLPVDPLVDAPPVDRCPACGGESMTGDKDVMDTWMTSSLTPQINDGWATNGFKSDPSLAPMSLRVQAFEIIRTWLFYSLVKSELHFNRLPWKAVMISGWGLNEQGKKISKRDLEESAGPDGFNRYVPDHVITRYGADALRLWATKARIGTDLRYNEKDIRTGRKFTVKMWNVGRFIQLNLEGFDPTLAAPAPQDRTDVDRWLLSHLAQTVIDVTAAFDEYDFMQAHLIASKFFWSMYCDRYIEMIKDRFLVRDQHFDHERLSAQWTLWESYRVLLGLVAPFTPFITEHMYQRFYRPIEEAVSVHVTRWPMVDEAWRSDISSIDVMVNLLDAIRGQRSRQRLGSNTRVSKIVVDARTPETSRIVASIAEPLRVAARANAVEVGAAENPTEVPGIFVALVQ